MRGQRRKMTTGAEAHALCRQRRKRAAGCWGSSWPILAHVCARHHDHSDSLAHKCSHTHLELMLSQMKPRRAHCALSRQCTMTCVQGKPMREQHWPCMRARVLKYPDLGVQKKTRALGSTRRAKKVKQRKHDRACTWQTLHQSSAHLRTCQCAPTTSSSSGKIKPAHRRVVPVAKRVSAREGALLHIVK
jgi:hypothetical protein